MVPEPEEWEGITPNALIPAIKHVREMFDESAWKCYELTRKLCHEGLHPGHTNEDVLAPYISNFAIYRAILGRASQSEFDRLLRAGTPPAIFHAFLDAFCSGLKTEVRRLFNDVLQIGLSNPETITIHPVEWAKVHLGSLIGHNSHLVGLWIKLACDNQATWKPIDAEEAVDDSIYWVTWRAPKLVHMMPSGNTPFDLVTAWAREDKPKTESVLNALTKRFVMSLRFALDKVAGEAHVECAKKSEAKIPPKQALLPNEAPTSVPKPKSSISYDDFSDGGRDGAATKPDIWRDFRNQFEALAREERERRAGESDRFLRAYCNYEDHPEGLERGKPEQGLVCLIAKPEYGLWMLGDGLDENFRERFDVLGTRAGIARGTPLREAALDYWLHNLYQNLLENKSRELFAVDKKGGMILHVCEASATYCSRLEKNALETSSPAKLQITSIHEVEPSLVKLGLADFSFHRLEKESSVHLHRVLNQAEERLRLLRKANPNRPTGSVNLETESDHAMAQTETIVRQIKAALALRDDISGNTEPASKRKIEEHKTETFSHSPDYRSVTHRGIRYPLTQQQAQAIKVLHEAYEEGNRELSGAFILEKIESAKSSRLRDVFRSSREAWTALIKQPRRGSYRLNL